MEHNIVDYIFECSNFQFLSDMKYCEDMRLYEIIEKTDPEDFSGDQWRELYEYLLDKKTSENDPRKIKLLLLQSL